MMQRIWKQLTNPNRPSNERGQDLSEYALLIGFIAIVVLISVNLLGLNIAALFEHLADIVGSIVI